jgi:hypothetical protein
MVNMLSLILPYEHIKGDIEKQMPTLTYRKLIKFGDDGLVLTVPKAWIRYYRLKAGDKLVVVSNRNLVIHPEGNEKRAKRRVKR